MTSSERRRRAGCVVLAAVAVLGAAWWAGAAPARAAAPVFDGLAGQRVSGAGVALPAGCTAANVTIDFGDGTSGPPDSVAGGRVSGSHVYARPGTYLGFLDLDQTCDGTTSHVRGTPGGDTLGFVIRVAPGPPVSTTAPIALSRSSVPVGGLLRLTPPAGSISGAARLDWDLNSDGRVNASCGADTPVLETHFSDAGSTTVSLGIVPASGGAPITLTAPLAVSAGAQRRTQSALSTDVSIPASQAYACIHDPLVRPTQDVTGNGGPPTGCIDRLVAGGGIEAVGCLTAVSATQIPGRELGLIDPILSTYSGSVPLARAGSQSLDGIASGSPPATGSHNASLSDYFPHISREPVRVNGVDIAPDPGAAVVIVPTGNGLLSNVIASSSATVSIGRFVLRRGPVVLHFGSGARVHVGDFNLGSAVPLADALSAQGRASVNMVRFASELTAHVALPPLLGGASGDVTLHADNDHGLVIDGFTLRTGGALLSGLPLHDVSVTYAAADDTLSGQASVVLPPYDLTAGLGFRRGRFDHLAPVSLDAEPGAGIPVGPGVFVTHLLGGVRVDPTEITAGVTVSAGQSVGGGCALVGVTADATLHFAPGPFALDAVGHGEVACLELGDVRLHVDSTGDVHIGAGFHKSFGPVSVNAQADFEVMPPHVQLDAQADGCVNLLGCAGGELVVSDKGLAFCADTTPHWGAGLEWPPAATFANPALFAAASLSNVNVMFTSCDIDQYRSIHHQSSTEVGGARLLEAPTTFAVPRGERELVVGVTGRGAVPSVTLRGPSGQALVLPATGALHTPSELAFPSPSDDTAYFAVEPPAAGTWTIEPQAGSAPIVAVRIGHRTPPGIHVEVRRDGAIRLLRYRVAPRAGQAVTFIEHAPGGDRVIGTTTATHGTLRFTPSEASGSRRTIVARITRAGVPRPGLTVARFEAPPTRLDRPTRLRVRIAGGRARVSWGPAALAQRYSLRADLSDGRHLMLLTPSARRRVTIPDVATATRLVVHVRGLRGLGTTGPAAALHVRAPGLAPPPAGAPAARVVSSVRPASVRVGRPSRVLLAFRAPLGGPVRVSITRGGRAVGSFPVRRVGAGPQTLGLRLPSLAAGSYRVRIAGPAVTSSARLKVAG